MILTYETKWSKVGEGRVEQNLKLFMAGLPKESSILQDIHFKKAFLINGPFKKAFLINGPLLSVSFPRLGQGDLLHILQTVD